MNIASTATAKLDNLKELAKKAQLEMEAVNIDMTLHTNEADSDPVKQMIVRQGASYIASLRSRLDAVWAFREEPDDVESLP